jgi:hypothetical protein
MSTAKSGYIQRKIVKVCEDIQVQYDGSVRDITGNIYQLSYGENGWDPSKTIKVNGESQICDIGRMITKLNNQHEETDICELKDEVEDVEDEVEKVKKVVKKVVKKPQNKSIRK